MKSTIVMLLLLGLFTSQVLSFLPELFDYDYNWMSDYNDDGDNKKTTALPPQKPSKPLEPQPLLFNNAGDGSLLGGITNVITQTKQNFVNVLNRFTQVIGNAFQYFKY